MSYMPALGFAAIDRLRLYLTRFTGQVPDTFAKHTTSIPYPVQ